MRPDGQPVSVATWYLLDGDEVLVNMDAGRRRLDYLRADPRVSLTVLDGADWYSHVSLQGRSCVGATTKGWSTSTDCRASTAASRTRTGPAAGQRVGRRRAMARLGRTARVVPDRVGVLSVSRGRIRCPRDPA